MLRPSPRSSDCVFDSENPLTADAADAGAPGPSSMLSRVSSLDPGETATTAQIVALFHELDASHGGTLNAEEMGQFLASLGQGNSPESVKDVMRQMWEAGGKAGPEDEATLDEFVAWWQTTGRWTGQMGEDDAGDGLKAAASGAADITKKLTAPARKVKSMVRGAEEGGVVRAVPAESMFLVDKGGNSDTRNRSDFTAKVLAKFEADFHQLRDVLWGQDNGKIGFLEVFEEAAAKSFDVKAAEQELAWPTDCLEAARAVFSRKAEDDIDRFWRHFLQSNPSLEEKEKTTLRRSSDLSAGAQRAEQVALSFLLGEYGLQHEQESISFDAALEAVYTALQGDIRVRAGKIEGLQARKKRHANTPRKIAVAGLRGDSAEANGDYIADGLRSFWGKPLYVQQRPAGSHSPPFFLFFAMNRVGGEWVDGMWVLAPTLNSERCTAFLREGEVEMLYPPDTRRLASDSSGERWQVYDVVNLGWCDAPGVSAPSFSVQIPPAGPDGGMAEYIQRAIDQQMQYQQDFEALLSDPIRRESVRLTLKTQQSKPGRISRAEFLAWRTAFYLEESQMVQANLRKQILVGMAASKWIDHSLEKDGMPSTQDLGAEEVASADFHVVDDIVKEYVWKINRSQAARQLAKQKFIARVAKPAMSRAFFSWKLACKQSAAHVIPSSGMFAEPALPWNVRHPRSTFTGAWEGIQAIILVYVAFTVVFRVAFNVPATGKMFWLEVAIDLYFVVDVVLNFHTAYYDSSGDLVAIAPTNKRRGFWVVLAMGSGADLKRLYTQYARGWMLIDVVSVVPWGTVFSWFQPEGAERTSADAKVLKILRLLRLSKLFRLARAMRIFKKYEDQLGPLVNALTLIGAVLLAIHSVACGWYFVGTFRDISSDPREEGSTGWVEHLFEGSEEVCGCHRSHDGQAYFFDTFESCCLHPSNSSELVREICTHTEDNGLQVETTVPGVWEYYNKALFTSMQDTGIGDGYDHNSFELISGSLVSGVFGFLWGAVAGAWSTIFSANQMAGQAYKMKLRQVKEFCRVKGLDFGTRAKLVAYYEHLYPESVIVNEQEILDDLPPTMKIDLVRHIYGTTIATVPIFYHLNAVVLTEICLALVELPVMKGEVVVRENQMGNEMYCVSSGQLRVSQHNTGGEDEDRVRVWIEEVMLAHGKPVRLYEPSQKKLLDRVLARVQSRGGADATVTYREMVNDDTLLAALGADKTVLNPTTTLKSLLQLAKKHKCVSYKGQLKLSSSSSGGVQDHGPRIQLLQVNTSHIRWDTAGQMLCAALQDGVVLCDMLNQFTTFPKIDVYREGGALQTLTGLATDVVGVADNAVTGSINAAVKVADKTASAVPDALGSRTLQKGVAMANDLNDATVGRVQAMTVEAAGTVDRRAAIWAKNINSFLAVLSDPDRNFNTGEPIAAAMNAGGDAGQHLFHVDDLIEFNQGSPQDQHKKQQRVVQCLLEFAQVVSGLEGYLGTRLDEVNLGTIGAGEFFGELALLPLKGGWKHQRTVTASGNGSLYYLTRQKIEFIAQQHQELKHQLHDHAEDFESMMEQNPVETSAPTKVDGQSAAKSALEHDPVGVLSEQVALSRHEIQELDLKLSALIGLVQSQIASK